MRADDKASVLRYHHRTKHRFEAYAKGPDTLDWDSQPNPFREFYGCEKIALPISDVKCGANLADIYRREIYGHSDASHDSKTRKNGMDSSLTIESLSDFLRLSLGLTAWKQLGPDKWSLRANPSSGNLHPTEAYVALGKGAGLKANHERLHGLYHYNAYSHELEKRSEFRSPVVLNTQALDRNALDEGFWLGLSSVIWREAWKYGERSFRYTQLDLGHALAALDLAAKALGWNLRYLEGLGGSYLAEFLGLERDEFNDVEREEAEVLVFISTAHSAQLTDLITSGIYATNSEQWYGKPNKLGEKTFYKWPVVDEIALVTQAKASDLNLVAGSQSRYSLGTGNTCQRLLNSSIDFGELAIARRSAQRFDKQPITSEDFALILAAIDVRRNSPLSRSFPRLHTVVMVHRVDGVASGLYVLSGGDQPDALLEKEMMGSFSWKPLVIRNGDTDQRLFNLVHGDYRKVAGMLFCQQAIASDCAFTLSFLVEFDHALESFGAHAYRSMHWQAGLFGHQVYIQASAAGLSATGIGCFFDDPLHELLGIKTTRLQTLYQVAVGGGITDNRISQFSAYHHLK